MEAKLVRKHLKRFVARCMGSARLQPGHFTIQQESMSKRGQLMALPGKQVEPVLDIDSASGTFGQFFYMAGYDPLGEAPLGG